MKMPFSRTRRLLRRNALLDAERGLIGLILVAIMALILIARFAFPGALTALVSPVWGAGTALTAATGGAAAYLADRPTLIGERDRLLLENEALVQNNRMLAAKAADLERLLGDRSDAGPGILAGVLARPPVAPYDVLVVDQGSEDGVTAGSLVSGPGGVPVGTVEEALPGSSRVLLYSAPGRQTEGWAGTVRTPVRLEGIGGGIYRASIAQDAAVIVGDTVYVPGPGSIPIGSVTSVTYDPSSPRSVIEVRPYVNIFTLPWVTIQPL
ncbi:MAG TPA: rod shape-determining protein MreC [Candidatus Paceibacterota bacterium]|nr:rod shape-determining protein MreC [Candidatus Paceibacterota bacterium]